VFLENEKKQLHKTSDTFFSSSYIYIAVYKILMLYKEKKKEEEENCNEHYFSLPVSFFLPLQQNCLQ